MNNVLGICNLHDEPNLGKLTQTRPLGTVTILGRYGIMDFTLSNFSNSGINKMCVLAMNGVQAIRNHIGDGQLWVHNTKTGFQRMVYNEKGSPDPKFNTDVMNILQNRELFEGINFDYVLIAPVFYVMSCDFNDVINAHIESGKEITAMYKTINNADEEFVNCETVEINKKGKIKGFSRNPGTKKSQSISLETFVVNRDLFFKICDMTKSVSSLFSFRKMVEYLVENKKLDLNGYEFKGFVLPLLTMPGFFKNSLKLLDQKEVKKLLKPDWPIYTTAHSTPPCLYGPDAKVEQTYIANGSKIEGTVINSILSRDVIVKKGAVVKNCILFTRTVIGENVTVENLICDKTSKIEVVKDLKGEKGEPLYISYGAKI